MIYVMSDLHGCYDEFMAMLDLIKFSKNDKLYILGDIIDRGPQPIDLLKYVMYKHNMTLIKGNHEDMMEKAVMTESKPALNLWMYNGGYTTYTQYNELSEPERDEILKYIIGLKYFHKINVSGIEYLLVHGGLYKGFDKDIKNGVVDGHALLWERPSEKLFRRQKGYKGCEAFFDKVICGHTPTVNYGKKHAGEILDWVNIIMIDTGGVYGYKFSCLCLDTGEKFYI